MNDAGKFDPGALNRVKSEIDASLHRAAEALGQYKETNDESKLKLCRTLTHQIRGALVMVCLEGPVQICDLLERVLGAIDEGKTDFYNESHAIIEQTLAALGQYLEDLMVGEPDQALRLLPIYRNLHELLADEPFRASDLFFPDLAIAPPERNELLEPLIDEELPNFLKRQRLNYQKGLLALLRNPPGSPPSAAALEQMRTALKSVENTQEETRPFWWISGGFIDALSDSAILSQKDSKRLCARIDLQIRRLLEGSTTLAERLMRDALYFIACASIAENTLGWEVRRTYRLDDLLPKTEIEPTSALKENTLRHLRECVVATEGFWNKYCAGNTAALNTFSEQARNCALVTQKLDNPDVQSLGEGLSKIAAWLVEDPTRNSDNVAMEVATAILLLQNAQANYRRLGPDYSNQVSLMIARLENCISGTPSSSDEEVPLLDDISRRAQERMLIVQVTREIQSCLGQIEEKLDTFFRNPEEGLDSKQVNTSLKQVKGALSMLGQDKVLETLEKCGEEITRFSQPGYQATQDDFSLVAHELSMLGLFVDALQSGPVNYEEFVSSLGEKEHAPTTRTEAPATVEVEIAQKKEETQALLEALKEAPDDTQIRAELKQNLQSLQVDADLVDDHTLGETAKAALTALESGASEAPELMATLAPQVAETPTPSAETLKLVQASDEELEAEFLEIFIEEAKEVLATMQEELEKLREEPGDIETLTNIRRATHTLKGSGRMVGLKSFGEFAWGIEQTLNVWCRQELEVTPEILELIDKTHNLASIWVEELVKNSGNAPDTSSLIAFAEKLRADKSVTTE